MAALLIFRAARRQAWATVDRLNQHEAKARPTRHVTVASIVLSHAALATGAILWWL